MSDTDAFVELEAIRQRRPDITSDGQDAPPVIVTVPADLCSQDLQVLVRHEFGSVFVDVRGDSHSAWTPIALTGGSFEVRSR